MNSDYQKVKRFCNLKDNEIDSHATDLYVIANEKTKKFFKEYGFTTFISQIDGKLWLDVPFYLLDDKITKAKEA